jgi:hypothetical protein
VNQPENFGPKGKKNEEEKLNERYKENSDY